MKPKNNVMTAAMTCVSLLASAALSQAATVIFSDDFNTAGGFVALQGTSGGTTSTGFTGNYYDGGNGGGNIYNPGGAGGMALGIATAKRDFTALGDTSTTTLLLRFDMFFTDVTNVAGTGASQEWGTFSFFNGASEIFAINNPWQSTTWGMSGGTVTVNNAVSNVGTTFQSAYIEFTLGVGATDSAKMWINPTQGGGYNPLSTPDVVSSGFNLEGVSTIRIGGTAENRVDNISLTAIPEPSTALLGGLGLLGLLRRRR